LILQAKGGQKTLMVQLMASGAWTVQGTAQLYQILQTKLKQQLQAFEQYAGETCLHIPAGLMQAEVNQSIVLC
jgi:hypothetical protein